MRVTYIGTSDIRSLTTEDLLRAGVDLTDEGYTADSEEHKQYTWYHNETVDVPEVIGEYLCEVYRSDFKSTNLINRDLRSKDELYNLAQKLQIPGRSTMNRDELAEAVDAAVADQANDSEGVETPQGVLEGLEQGTD